MKIIYAFEKPNDISLKEIISDETEIVLPSHIDGVPVTSIESYAFVKCRNLKKLTLPENIHWMSNKAFEKAPALQEIVFKGTEEEFYWEAHFDNAIPEGITVTCEQ